MKKVNVYFAVIALFSVLFSCKSDDEDSDKAAPYNPAQPVVLKAFHPEAGRIAEKIMLEGANFGTDPSLVRVWFNNKQASVISAEGERMLCLAPRMPGDTCTVSVVIGSDSVVFSQKFYYSVSVSVSTVVGNGIVTLKDGNLAEAQVEPSHMCADNEGNLFVCFRNNPYGIVRINEEENILTTLISASSAVFIPDALCTDLETGIIYVPSESAITNYFTFDPKEGWAPRSRNWEWGNLNGYALPTNAWKHSMGFCKLDGCIYTRFYEGQLVKLNPRTNTADIVASVAPSGTTVGCTFHPRHPELLYIVGRSGQSSGGIYTVDVTNPANTIKRLNPSGTGYRDGELSQALFFNPWQVYFDPDGTLYIPDEGNHCIRKIRPDNIVETVVGMPGTAGWKDGGKEDALFNSPRGVTVLNDGTVYVCDYGNKRVRKLAIE
jgi:DNA-binding beta-propeller fold protein YncE